MTRDYWTRWRLPPKISRGFLVALPLLLLLRAQLEKLAIWHILTCCTCVPHVVKLDKKSCFLVLEEELLAPDLGREPTEMLSQSAKPTSQSGQAQVSRMPHWMPPWSALVKSAAICKDVARCYKKHKKTQLYLPISALLWLVSPLRVKEHVIQSRKLVAQPEDHSTSPEQMLQQVCLIRFKVWSRIEYNALNMRIAKSAKGCNKNVMECARILHEVAWGCMRLHDLDIISLRCLIAVVILHVRPSKIAKDWSSRDALCWSTPFRRYCMLNHLPILIVKE